MQCPSGRKSVGMKEQMTTMCHDYPDAKCSLTVSLLAIFPLFLSVFFFKLVLESDKKRTISFNGTITSLLIANKLYAKLSIVRVNSILINDTYTSILICFKINIESKMTKALFYKFEIKLILWAVRLHTLGNRSTKKWGAKLKLSSQTIFYKDLFKIFYLKLFNRFGNRI